LEAVHEDHLARIIANVSKDLDAKYRLGQEEHGGYIWEKPGMLEHAIEEALDLVVYLYVLRDQLGRGFKHNGRDAV
jgi:hypothetical protein